MANKRKDRVNLIEKLAVRPKGKVSMDDFDPGYTWKGVKKENAKQFHHFNAARVAIASGDLAKARSENETFMQQAQAKQNPFQIRLGHEVAGSIALAEKSWDEALTHLDQANLQDPYNLYRQGLAYEGKGDPAKAKEKFASAVGFNQLPTINSALVRMKARQQKA